MGMVYLTLTFDPDTYLTKFEFCFVKLMHMGSMLP